MHPTEPPATSMHVIGYMLFTFWGAGVGFFLGWLVFA